MYHVAKFQIDITINGLKLTFEWILDWLVNFVQMPFPEDLEYRFEDAFQHGGMHYYEGQWCLGFANTWITNAKHEYMNNSNNN